jgi:hypothetical protein
MKKFCLPSLNRSSWGKALLAAGLLLVAVAGVLQLQAVQAVFFPGRYHALELKVIRHECVMIDKGLISLRADMTNLQRLCAAASPHPGGQVRLGAQPGFPAALHTAKKDRVYVARKLRYVDIMLKSLHQAVERQRASHPGAGVDSKPEMEKTLGQIREIRARCQAYTDELQKISDQLQQYAGCIELQ